MLAGESTVPDESCKSHFDSWQSYFVRLLNTVNSVLPFLGIHVITGSRLLGTPRGGLLWPIDTLGGEKGPLAAIVTMEWSKDATREPPRPGGAARDLGRRGG